MPTHGRVSEYNSGEDFHSYVEQLGFYFSANDVTDNNKKKAIFLSCCGKETYCVARNVVQPETLVNTEYTDIIKALTEYYCPKPSSTIQRSKFNVAVRKPGQSVSAFIAELKQISEHCNFGDQLKQNLADRILVGVNHSRIQTALLDEKDLTYDKALEIAFNYEATDKNVLTLGEQHVRAEPPQKQNERIHKVFHSGKKHDSPRQKKIFQQTQSSNGKQCYRCLGSHSPYKCFAKDLNCNYCKKKGHIVKACRTKLRKSGDTNCVTVPDDVTEERGTSTSTHEYTVYRVNKVHVSDPPYQIQLDVDGRSLNMELDTGASSSLISKATLDRHYDAVPRPKLSAGGKLTMYSGAQLQVEGEITVQVKHNNQVINLPLIVVSDDGPTLLGRNWLKQLTLDWKKVAQVNTISASNQQLTELVSKYEELFQDGLGTLKGVTAKFQVALDEKPRFFKSRPVPYSIRESVNKELIRLENEGIIEHVQHADWAAPIVPVVKSNGNDIRLCGDYKVTINAAMKTDSYPIPRVEDLYARLSGGAVFSTLDLSNAYLQVALDAESKKYTTVNTPRGLYQYTRLPFGISSSPGIFQRCMDNLLSDIPGVCCYLDDVLLSAPTEAENIQLLEKVFSRLTTAGLRLKKSKCTFLAKEVSYLGHKIDESGLHPLDEKVRAIADAPTPTCLAELQHLRSQRNFCSRQDY
jgi:hypothetical protein